jgi:predicted transcriptional regulator
MAKRKTGLHDKRQPRLSTIRMVEAAIKKDSGEFTKTQLWRALNKKMMYQTFAQVIDYLEESGKIIIQNKKVIWIYYPQVAKKIIEEGTEIKEI